MFSPSFAYSFALHWLGITGLTILSIGLIGVGLYIILFTTFKPVRLLGVLALGAGCIIGAYTKGSVDGGQNCENRHLIASYEAKLRAQAVADKAKYDKLQLELKAQKEASQFVEKQREELEQQDAERQKLFEEYRRKHNKLAETCRLSRPDDASVVCAISGNTAAGCAAPAHNRNSKRVR